jgi:signal transduction histidine kinase
MPGTMGDRQDASTGPTTVPGVLDRFARRSLFEQDAILASAACVAGLLTLVLEPEDAVRGVERSADVLGVALVVGMSLPLAWRRTAPLASLLLPAGCALAGAHLGYAVLVNLLVVMVAVGSAAMHGGRRRAIVLGALCGLAVASIWLADEHGGVSFSGLLVALAIGASPALVGYALGTQRELTAQVRAHAARLDELRQSEVHAIVAEERVQMARDIHDVVGHHLSAIALQTHAARRIADQDPTASTHALAAVSELTSEALSETRLMLHALRRDGTETAPVAGLDQLETLVEARRASGLQVDVTVRGERPRLPAATDTCALRILQEALTNVAKHARPARVRVDLQFTRHQLTLSVDDDGRRAWRRSPGGHGLAGMAERAALVGGTFHAGPRPAGGWSVHATLPISPHTA